MKRFYQTFDIKVFSIILFSLILFFPGFSTYFHQDDFIHLFYSQTLRQVISAFNIFQKGDFPFYRPIPTQTYFYLGKLVFGLNPFSYHVVNFLAFSLNVFLVYRLVKLISGKKEIAFIAVFFFAVNSTHFAPLYSPAYIHELFYVLFGVLTVTNFFLWVKFEKRKHFFFSGICFIAALMSKETAVILPIILCLIYLFSRKKKICDLFINIIPFFLILIIYLFAHFYFYGIASGPSYRLILGKQAINMLIWYFLWALSVPNILIDFLEPGLRLNSIFFQVTKINGWIFIILFPLLILFGLTLFMRMLISMFKGKHFKEISWMILGILWFIVGMIPLIVFPLHKLATEQAFSLVGLSLAIGVVCYANLQFRFLYKFLSIAFILVYLAMATNSIILGRSTHWIVRSAQQAKSVIDFFQVNYPELVDNSTIYFKNGEIKIPEYGSSRQIYQALGNGVGLKIVLNKPNLHVYFEDINPPALSDKKNDRIIELDSSKFLGY